jgi:hypothetical protein
LGSTLHCGFPFLRWQNHVRPRTPLSTCSQESLHHGTVNDVTFAPGLCGANTIAPFCMYTYEYAYRQNIHARALDLMQLF